MEYQGSTAQHLHSCILFLSEDHQTTRSDRPLPSCPLLHTTPEQALELVKGSAPLQKMPRSPLIPTTSTTTHCRCWGSLAYHKAGAGGSHGRPALTLLAESWPPAVGWEGREDGWERVNRRPVGGRGRRGEAKSQRGARAASTAARAGAQREQRVSALLTCMRPAGTPGGVDRRGFMPPESSSGVVPSAMVTAGRPCMCVGMGLPREPSPVGQGEAGPSIQCMHEQALTPFPVRSHVPRSH